MKENAELEREQSKGTEEEGKEEREGEEGEEGNEERDRSGEEGRGIGRRGKERLRDFDLISTDVSRLKKWRAYPPSYLSMYLPSSLSSSLLLSLPSLSSSLLHPISVVTLIKFFSTSKNLHSFDKQPVEWGISTGKIFL
jgi:hypothetical protein